MLFQAFYDYLCAEKRYGQNLLLFYAVFRQTKNEYTFHGAEFENGGDSCRGLIS